MRMSNNAAPASAAFTRDTDNYDRQIVRLLQQDGRMSNRAIADKIGVSEGTVRNRIKRLKELGLVRVTALVNLYEDPEAIAAYVLIRLTNRDLIDYGRKFAQLPGVVSVAAVAGQYDLIVEVLVDSKTRLIEFVTEHLASVAEVQTAETLVILKSFNKWAELSPDWPTDPEG